VTDTAATDSPGIFSRGASAGGSAASSYTSRLTTTANSRTIFGFMAFAVLFSVVGAEIRNVQSASLAQGPGLTALHNPPTGNGAAGLVADPVAIFFGGTMATGLLVLLADTGETGRRLGVGLAGITLAASLLVNGGPVWRAVGHLTGSSQPTTPTGATSPTTPTGAATPTGSTTATA
jgi:hypothetical protein